MGNVGRELLYWADAPGVVQVGIDPGTEWTGLAFVQWPFYLMGTAETEKLLLVLNSAFSQLCDVPKEFMSQYKGVALSFEQPGSRNGKTWWVAGHICGFVRGLMWLTDGWIGPPKYRELSAQRVRARVSKVDDLLGAMQPLDLEVEGLLDTRPVHAREALATLIR